MKKLFFAFAMIVLIISIIAANILFSTGFFREVTPADENAILTKIPLAGVEDIAIAREDTFLILSADDRAARRDRKSYRGSLQYLDLNDHTFSPKNITSSFTKTLNPHGISMLKIDSSRYRLACINHVDGHHSIEMFDLYGDSIVHVMTFTDPLLVSPNDLVLISENQFYVTNSQMYHEGLMSIFEKYLGLATCNVVYFDGSKFSEVANDIAYANGINFDHERNLLFVASSRDFEVNVYNQKLPGSLDMIESIPVGSGVDNIEFDENGVLWIGSHPNLLAFSAYAAGKKPMAPSEVITIDYQSKGVYSINSVFIDDGSSISASSVAIPVGKMIFVGNVMDQHLLILNSTK